MGRGALMERVGVGGTSRRRLLAQIHELLGGV